MSDAAAAPRPRLRRNEAKARTRSQLLEAAAIVFAHQGYAGASVDDIADAAGFTTGALYSNFSGKQELFLELLSARSSLRLAEAVTAIGDVGTPVEQRRARLSQLLVDVADEDRDLVMLHAECWLYAVRQPDLRAQLASRFRDNRDALAIALSGWARGHNRADEIPLDSLATVVLALFQGLVQVRRTDPALVSDDLYATAIRWLFAGMPSPSDGRTAQ